MFYLPLFLHARVFSFVFHITFSPLLPSSYSFIFLYFYLYFQLYSPYSFYYYSLLPSFPQLVENVPTITRMTAPSPSPTPDPRPPCGSTCEDVGDTSVGCKDTEDTSGGREDEINGATKLVKQSHWESRSVRNSHPQI